jgi:hypothetical protein
MAAAWPHCVAVVSAHGLAALGDLRAALSSEVAHGFVDRAPIIIDRH